jgi:hypothetical protein
MNLKYLVVSLLNTGLIIYVSSMPNHCLPGDGSLSDQIVSNVAHIPAYGLLTFLWLKTFDRRKNTTQLHNFPASQLPSFTKSQLHKISTSQLLGCAASQLRTFSTSCSSQPPIFGFGRFGSFCCFRRNSSIIYPRSLSIRYRSGVGPARCFLWVMCIQQAQTTQQIKSIERIEHLERA